jgi:hypothetical protein
MTILLLQKVKTQFTTFGGLKENPVCAGLMPDSLINVTLLRRDEAAVGCKRDQKQDFQHSGPIDG